MKTGDKIKLIGKPDEGVFNQWLDIDTIEYFIILNQSRVYFITSYKSVIEVNGVKI